MRNFPYRAFEMDEATFEAVWARFQEVLESASVPHPQRFYHRRWVDQWLDRLQGAPPPRDAAREYAQQLESEGFPDWQCRQAMRSVESWLDARHAVLAERDATRAPTAGLGWDELLAEMEKILWIQRYSPRTAESYLMWVRKFSARCREVPVDGEVASRAIDGFLRELALAHNLASASVAQARNALAWFFRRQMGYELDLEDKGSAHHGRRIPQVIADVKVRELLDQCSDPWDLFFGLQYGCGLRLMELLDLRVGELDLERRILTIRHGKGNVDRQALIPSALHDRVAQHLAWRKEQWESDLERGFASVDIPTPRGGKPRESTEWMWQHVFGAPRPLKHPESGRLRRWRPLEINVRNELREVASKVGIVGRVHPHLLRHCFATHLLEAGVPIQQIQEQLGHARLATTMIYLHVKSPVEHAKSPLDLVRVAHPLKVVAAS